MGIMPIHTIITKYYNDYVTRVNMYCFNIVLLYSCHVTVALYTTYSMNLSASSLETASET